MCLAIPARLESIGHDETAMVDLGGVRRRISLALLDDARVGDYVIVHVGFALHKLDVHEAERTLALFASGDSGGDSGEEGMPAPEVAS